MNEVETTAMSITIQLPPDAEKNLREQASLQGRTPEEHLGQLAQQWLRSNGAPAATQSGKELSKDEWLAEFRAWVASHKPVHHFVDDSRESIYAGRGE